MEKDMILMVHAPLISDEERLNLEAHLRETLKDPDYNFVVNYDLTYYDVVREDGPWGVVMDGASVEEVTYVAAAMDEIMARSRNVVVFTSENMKLYPFGKINDIVKEEPSL